MYKDIFEELFVLELANNHLGDVKRGLKIISDYSKIVRFNNIRAAIKLQFRDVNNFVHKEFQGREDIRYIRKTLATKISEQTVSILANAIRKSGCMPMATTFDEKSVDLCVRLDLPIIKIASSDINDWPLIEAIAKPKKPVIASTGGSSLKDLDDLVSFFEKRNIPLGINHCVSIYPSEDSELELNQIDFLKNRFPDHVIGFSTHEYHDWSNSMLIAYAKGARTFERHIDVEMGDSPISPYCSLPYQIDTWFKSYQKAKEMCGGSGETKRIPLLKEIQYLDSLVRGVYAKKNLPKNHVIREEDIYLAIPLLQGQISCREVMAGEAMITPVKKNESIFIDMIESPYVYNAAIKKQIYSR